MNAEPIVIGMTAVGVLGIVLGALFWLRGMVEDARDSEDGLLKPSAFTGTISYENCEGWRPHYFRFLYDGTIEETHDTRDE